MRNKLAVFLMALLMTTIVVGRVHAGCDGNTDVFNTTGWCINSDGNLSSKVDQNGGTFVRYENITAGESSPNELATTETGKFIVDNVGIKHVLPRATVGAIFTIASGAKVPVTVDTVDTSDTILWSSSNISLDAGDSLTSTTQAGDAITVICPVANKWVVVSQRGTWFDNGTN